MHTITSKIPDDLYVRLDQLSKIVDRKKSYLIRKAIASFLEEREDYYIALHRLEENGPTISLEELEAGDELED